MKKIILVILISLSFNLFGFDHGGIIGIKLTNNFIDREYRGNLDAGEYINNDMKIDTSVTLGYRIKNIKLTVTPTIKYFNIKNLSSEISLIFKLKDFAFNVDYICSENKINIKNVDMSNIINISFSYYKEL